MCIVRVNTVFLLRIRHLQLLYYFAELWKDFWQWSFCVYVIHESRMHARLEYSCASNLFVSFVTKDTFYLAHAC